MFGKTHKKKKKTKLKVFNGDSFDKQILKNQIMHLSLTKFCQAKHGFKVL